MAFSTECLLPSIKARFQYSNEIISQTTEQQGGKGAGRSRKKIYRYAKDVEKG